MGWENHRTHRLWTQADDVVLSRGARLGRVFALCCAGGTEVNWNLLVLPLDILAWMAIVLVVLAFIGELLP